MDDEQRHEHSVLVQRQDTSIHQRKVITMLKSAVLKIIAVGTIAIGSLGTVAVAEAGATTPARAAITTEAYTAAAKSPAGRAAAGNWAWYGYRLNRAETNQIANVSLWSAVSGVKGSGLIPYSTAIMAVYSINWVLTARNARSMGQCLAISYAGTGLIVGC
jgi:hypothetical protein